MKNSDSFLKIAINIIIPYILLYAIYIQINGENSPGGGFQAGAIFASMIVGYHLVYTTSLIKGLLQTKILIRMAAIGVTISIVTGIIPLINGHNYLNYYAILPGHIGQFLGIFIFELGIGITVSSSLLMIYIIMVSENS